jgi:hypothetical protein
MCKGLAMACMSRGEDIRWSKTTHARTHARTLRHAHARARARTHSRTYNKATGQPHSLSLAQAVITHFRKSSRQDCAQAALDSENRHRPSAVEYAPPITVWHTEELVAPAEIPGEN